MVCVLEHLRHVSNSVCKSSFYIAKSYKLNRAQGLGTPSEVMWGGADA